MTQTGPSAGTKFILKSKTVVGVAIGFVPTLMALIGVDWSAEQTQEIKVLIDAGITLAGAGIAIWGRYSAANDNRTITVVPFKKQPIKEAA